MKNPKISVVISVRNQEKYLIKAVQSILNQSYTNFELLIVDDASKDNSGNILKSIKDPRVKIITNSKHIGLTKSLNLAINKSTGEYIARMDADDISYPERLKTEMAFLEKHPEIALVGSWVELINEAGKRLSLKRLPCTSLEIKNKLIKANQFYHPTLLIRKEVLLKYGLYDEKFEYSQDYELILRIASHCQVANIPESLLMYRVNSKGAISYEKVKQQAYFALLARLKALKDYRYPITDIKHLIRPIISFLTPKPILMLIYKQLYFKNE